MKMCFALASASVALVAGVALAGPPAIHMESGDAGQLIPTAQPTSGMGLLNLIQGSFVVGQDVDMFCINIVDVMNFTATVADNGRDTQLFLFRPDGTGVAADDDGGGGFFNAFLDGRFVTSPGLYYIAISRFDVDPYDTNNASIWDDNESYLDAPVSNLPLAGWDSNTTDSTFDYEIRFTGAEFSDCTVIPLPTGGLMGLAGLGVMASIRRRRLR